MVITKKVRKVIIVQELCESRGGRPGLSVLTSFLVSEDVKNYRLNHASALVSALSLICQPGGDI